jgi:hypothetical protein
MATTPTATLHRRLERLQLALHRQLSVPLRQAGADKGWEKRPREEVHATGPPFSRARGAPRGGEQTLDDILDAKCPYHKDMRHTLRNCRDFKHSIGMADHSSLYHLPHHEEGLASPGNLSNSVGAKAKTPPFARCLRQTRCTNGDKTIGRLYPSSHVSQDEGL